MFYTRAQIARDQPEKGPIRFIASTEGVKRDGRDLKITDWRIDNYRRNPVVLVAHDYIGRLPVGRADVGFEGSSMIANITFDPDDPLAQEIERKYRAGFMHAVSVGWDTQEDGGNELLDISVVNVPGDPDALIQRQMRALLAFKHELLDGVLQSGRRGAIPPHTTPKADEDEPWDADAEVKKVEGAAALRRMHAWVNEAADPDTKGAYKLPHHKADGRVVWRGVAAAMSRLMQKGTDIPEADWDGVYRHLVRHYEQFDKEPPERVHEAENRRIGAVLNARNVERLENAKALIQEVLDSAKKEQPETDKGEGNDDARVLETILNRLMGVSI